LRFSSLRERRQCFAAGVYLVVTIIRCYVTPEKILKKWNTGIRLVHATLVVDSPGTRNCTRRWSKRVYRTGVLTR
jgi:hypothetical protein